MTQRDTYDKEFLKTLKRIAYALEKIETLMEKDQSNDDISILKEGA